MNPSNPAPVPLTKALRRFIPGRLGSPSLARQATRTGLTRRSGLATPKWFGTFSPRQGRSKVGRTVLCTVAAFGRKPPKFRDLVLARNVPSRVLLVVGARPRRPRRPCSSTPTTFMGAWSGIFRASSRTSFHNSDEIPRNSGLLQNLLLPRLIFLLAYNLLPFRGGLSLCHASSQAAPPLRVKKFPPTGKGRSFVEVSLSVARVLRIGPICPICPIDLRHHSARRKARQS